MQHYFIYFPYFTIFKFGPHHQRSPETSGSNGCDSNLRDCRPKPLCRLDYSQFLCLHNTADIHGLNFAAHCIPFLPGTPPSSWAIVSQRFYSPLYLRTHQYLLQCLLDRVNNGGRQTHRYPLIVQSHASILRTASRLPSRTPGGLLGWTDGWMNILSEALLLMLVDGWVRLGMLDRYKVLSMYMFFVCER